MKEYTVITRCLSTLKSSKLDVMTKLRIEKMLLGMTMLLQGDLSEQDGMPDLEELVRRIDAVCSGQSADGVKGVVEHVRRVQTARPYPHMTC